MTRRARLLVIGQDFPIRLKTVIRTPSKRSGYKYDRELKLQSKNVEVQVDAVKEKIKELQEKYPDKGFFFEKHMVINRSAVPFESRAICERKKMAYKMMCWIIGRRNPDLKLRKKDVPIYWSSRFQRLYVPKSYYDRNHRLTCSVISYRVRDLGIPFRLTYV